jgi:hypothetical protein
MKFDIWGMVASAATSITVGVIIVVLLVIYDRVWGRLTTSGKFVGCLLLTTAVYTLVVTVIGYFYIGVPIQQTIGQNFGEARFAWLCVGLAADGCARIYGYFD